MSNLAGQRQPHAALLLGSLRQPFCRSQHAEMRSHSGGASAWCMAPIAGHRPETQLGLPGWSMHARFGALQDMIGSWSSGSPGQRCRWLPSPCGTGAVRSSVATSPGAAAHRAAGTASRVFMGGTVTAPPLITLPALAARWRPSPCPSRFSAASGALPDWFSGFLFTARAGVIGFDLCRHPDGGNLRRKTAVNVPAWFLALDRFQYPSSWVGPRHWAQLPWLGLITLAHARRTHALWKSLVTANGGVSRAGC